MFFSTIFSPGIGLLIDRLKQHFNVNICVSVSYVTLIAMMLLRASPFEFVLFGVTNSSRNVIQMLILNSILSETQIGIGVALVRGVKNTLAFLIVLVNGFLVKNYGYSAAVCMLLAFAVVILLLSVLLKLEDRK